MADALIGVTGATGELGGRVVTRLAERGVPQRLIVRDRDRAPAVEGADIAIASDYGAGDEMRAALAGVETLLLVPAREAQNRVAQHVSAIDAAAAAGVRRIVYFSFVGAAPDAIFIFGRDHWATEEHIRAGGLSFTFVRMSLYLDFVPAFVDAEGVIRGPAGEGRLAPVARDDLADVATEVLLGADHEGEAIPVTGGRRFTLGEAAGELSRLTGSEIVFRDETIEEAYATRAQLGAPDWAVDGWVSSYVAIARGELDVVSDAVARIAGHPPMTLEEYVRAYPRSVGHIAKRR
jgi:NAD(P)H dehydrogenase (quinone)